MKAALVHLKLPEPSDHAFFSISHCLSMVELRPSSSMSTGCVVSLREDWAIFCHAGSGRVGRVRSAREKSLEILRRGWELNPGHGEDRQWAIPQSYHDHVLYASIQRDFCYKVLFDAIDQYSYTTLSFMTRDLIGLQVVGRLPSAHQRFSLAWKAKEQKPAHRLHWCLMHGLRLTLKFHCLS